MNPNVQHLQAQQAGQQQGFCGVPGADLALMAQAAWGQMDGGAGGSVGGAHLGAAHLAAAQHPCAMVPQCGGMSSGSCAGDGLLGPGGGMHPGAGMQGGPGMHAGLGAGQMHDQACMSISLSAQAELELELSLRGSLLVQQQRRIVQLEDELQRAWSEIDRLRVKIQAAERDRQRVDEDSSKQPRYWTPDEHRLFMEAVQRFGWKDVKSIAQHVGTRTPTQVRTHAQKLFLRQQKESNGLMAPSKSGRSDGIPGGLGGLDPYSLAGAPGTAGSSSMGADQLQQLQEAGSQLEERGGSLDGDDGGSGCTLQLPDGTMASIASMSNPDADPNAPR